MPSVFTPTASLFTLKSGSAALAIAAALLASGLVQAADAPPSATAERSRAEVVAELVKARAEGMMPAENEVDPFTTQRRAEAKAKQAATQMAGAAKAHGR